MTERADGKPFEGGSEIQRIAAILAVIGALGLAVGAAFDLDRFFLSYLAAYTYVTTVALGALVFLMIGHAMRAGWPTLLRRLTEAITASIPILAVLFIPLLFGLRRLYPWLRIDTIEGEADRELVRAKIAYLEPTGFALRALLYLAIFTGVASLLRRWSQSADAASGARARDRMYVLSAALLPVVALALSFASFDWLMSLLPAWVSTIFPVYVFAGGFVSAIALLTLLTAASDASGAISGIKPSHYYALGRLLLAFTIFWAYVAYFQLMLQWIGNRPDEAPFYLARARGGYLVESIVLVACQFVLPFFLLLPYGIKRRRAPLARVAALILAAHYVDAHWLVLPSASPRVTPIHPLDLAALLALGGVATVFAVRRARGIALVPTHDPALPRALRYDSA